MNTNQAAPHALRPYFDAVASSLAVTLREVCKEQDAVTMQILAIARLARHTLDSEVPDALDDIGYALDSIIRIAGEANVAIDEAQGAPNSRASQPSRANPPQA